MKAPRYESTSNINIATIDSYGIGTQTLNDDNPSNIEFISDISTVPEAVRVKIFTGAQVSVLNYTGTETSTATVIVDNDKQTISVDASVIIHGYYFVDKFYKDSTYTEEIIPTDANVYVDDNSGNKVYIYNKGKNDTEYHWICLNDGNEIPDATENMKGVLKLYKTTGQNEDGTMTQRSITDALDNNVDVNADEELLIFKKSI